MGCGGKGECKQVDGYSSFACEVHWVALNLQGFNHRGFCEECCDLPRLMGELETHGLDIVKHAFRHMSRKQAQYWRRMLRILETGNPK